MKKKLCIIALSAMMLGGAVGLNALPTQKASAGWMQTTPVNLVKDNGEAYDKNEWYKNADDPNVYYNEGMKSVIFDYLTGENASLINRKKLEVDEDIPQSKLSISATIEVINEGTFEVDSEDGEVDEEGNPVKREISVTFPEGKRFGIGFGMQRLRSIVGEDVMNYFYVERKGNGYVAGLAVYADDGGEIVEVLKQNPVAVSGTVFDFSIEGNSDNTVTAKIGSQVIYSGEIPENPLDGYFGFMESDINAPEEPDVNEDDLDALLYGRCSREFVSEITVTNDYYANPENVNINDDFEDESIDTSLWSLSNQGSYMKGVAETDGMLRFIDSNDSTLATRYTYSNFEMRLDVPYIKRHADFTPEGKLRSAACNWFGFFCGIDTDSPDAINGTTKVIQNYTTSYLLTFRTKMEKGVSLGEGTEVLFGTAGSERKIYKLPSQYDIWDLRNEDRTLNIVFTSIDGNYALEIKWDDETEYYKVFSEKLTVTTGYIALAAYGDNDTNSVNKANLAYDNVRIINRDYKGVLLSGINKGSNNLIPDDEKDFGYADSKSPSQLIQDGTDFDGVKAIVEEMEEEEKGCGSFVDIGTASVAMLAAGVAVLKKRRNK